MKIKRRRRSTSLNSWGAWSFSQPHHVKDFVVWSSSARIFGSTNWIFFSVSSFFTRSHWASDLHWGLGPSAHCTPTQLSFSTASELQYEDEICDSHFGAIRKHDHEGGSPKGITFSHRGEKWCSFPENIPTMGARPLTVKNGPISRIHRIYPELERAFWMAFCLLAAQPGYFSEWHRSWRPETNRRSAIRGTKV